MNNKELFLLFRVIMAIIIALISFKLSLLVTNSFVIFKSGLGSWVVNIFLLPTYIIIFIPLMGSFCFGFWNLLNYLLEKNNLIKPSAPSSLEHDKETSKLIAKKSYIQKTLIGIVSSIGAAIVVIGIFGAIIGGFGKKQNNITQNKYEKTFQTLYEAEEYNDDRIVFYKQELEK